MGTDLMQPLKDLLGLPGRLWNATRYSLQGLRAACRHEQAFRLELLALVAVVPAGLWLGKTGGQRALLIGSWALVLVVELLNSALEALADRMGREPHELAGRAKDLGSAAVFCAIATAALTWAMVLLGP
jgi:diacylglycerol kinase (ATP)